MQRALVTLLLAGLVLGLVVSTLATRERRARASVPAAASSPEGRAPPPAVLASEAEPYDAAQAAEAGEAEELAADPAVDERAVVEAAAQSTGDDLVVRVVHPGSGARPAADVPLVLELPNAEERITTGADGRARFVGGRAALLAAAAPVRLLHALCFASCPVLELWAPALPDGPVTSVLPPSGSIEVLVLECDGSKAADDAWVELELVDEAQEALDPLRAEERPHWGNEVREGRALFSYVELGRVWEARARRAGGDGFSHVRAAGPVRLGERTQLEVKLGADHPVVRFRAVDAGGKPFAGVQLKLAADRGFYPEESDARTDENGCFFVDVDTAFFLRVSTIAVRYTRDDGTLLQGQKEMPTTVLPGLHDGGDVVLGADDLMVAGVVVDEGGRPLADVTVAAGPFIQFRTSNMHRAWLSGRSSTKSDAAGRFELRGELIDREIELMAYSDRVRSESLQVQVGQRDVVLVASARWIVEGRLLVDEGVAPTSFGLALVPAGEEGSRADLSVDEEGVLRNETVETGLYSLVVSLGEERVREVEDVLVAGDLDLGVVDLSGTVVLHRLELEGAADPAALRGELAWRASGSSDAWTGQRFEGAEVLVTSAADLIDVELRPEGFRHELVERVSGTRRIVLRGPLVVVLELDTAGEIPAYPYIFDPDPRRGDVRVGIPDGSPYFTAEHRSVRFLLSVPGKIRIGWHLERRGDNWAVGGNVLEAYDVELDILDVAGEQVFRLPLPADVLTELTRNPPF